MGILGFVVARMMEQGEKTVALAKMRELLKPPSISLLGGPGSGGSNGSGDKNEGAGTATKPKEKWVWPCVRTRERRDFYKALTWVVLCKAIALIVFTQSDRTKRTDIDKSHPDCNWVDYPSYNSTCDNKP